MPDNQLNYIISGIPPSKAGVGRVMEYLVRQNHDEFSIIYPNIYNPKKSLRYLLVRKSYFTFFTEFLKHAYSIIVHKSIFKWKIIHLKSKNVLLIHPQSIGCNNVIKLIENNNSYIYLMDCSFFCVKSYNHFDKTYDSCLLCLGGNYEYAKMHNCKPFPRKYRLNDNIKFLEKINDLSNKMTFITQNHSQTKLIKKHYGDGIKVHEVGLFAKDFEEIISSDDIKKRSSFDMFDFVFHGVATDVKGLSYVLNIASELKQYSFLIPASYEKCEKVLGDVNLNNDLLNVKFLDITWESGLKEYVMNSKVVLCPSLWSAPIEGALIKSFIFNGVVALVPASYSFVNDLPESIYCKLNVNDLNETTKILIELIENEMYRNDLRESAHNWVEVFLNDNRTIVKKLNNIITRDTLDI